MIFFRIRLSLVIAALCASPTRAADPSVPAADAVAVDAAGERGRMIYAYDRAGWFGVADAIAKLPDAKAKIGGWFVEGSAEAPRVTFYDRASPPGAVYLVSVAKGQPLGGHAANASEKTLKPEQLARIAALRAAKTRFQQAGAAMCGTRPFNSVAIGPKAAGGDTLVYFLTPQTDAETYPMGGHYRIEVDAKGVAGAVHGFGPCQTVSGKAANGAKAPIMPVASASDAAPTEIHVYTMYAAAKPVLLSTAPSKRMWLIDEVSGGTRIRVVTARAK